MPSWIISAPTGPTTGASFVALIENLINWFFVAFLLLAAVFIVLAGWQFISAQGNPEEIARARQKLFWAAAAIVVAVLSRGFVAAIQAIIVG